MFREMMKSKIHRAAVTDSNLNYEGSITIGRELLQAADILPFEKVQVVNINNGSRFETYAMESDIEGTVCANGAAARLAHPGDIIIIMAYAYYETGEIEDRKFCPRVIKVDENNKIKKTTD